MKEILDVIHNTIYQFFDVCGDEKEVPMSDKDELLLQVNKAICNNLKALEQEPCEDAISRQAAIDGLNKINGTSELDKAFEVIENLPSVQPKIEPCEDAISREAALEAFSDYVSSGYADSVEDFEEYSKIIAKLPSVQPKQKTEHLINKVYEALDELEREDIEAYGCKIPEGFDAERAKEVIKKKLMEEEDEKA